MAACVEYKFIQDGYRDYHSLAVHQVGALGQNSFWHTLINGLSGLIRLNAIVVKDQWEPIYGSLMQWFEAPKREVGSPLARSWDMFRLDPDIWDVGHKLQKDSTKNAAEILDLIKYSDFPTLTRALSETHKHIRSFKTNGMVIPGSYLLNPFKPILLLDFRNAFVDLETLKLDFSAFWDGDGAPLRRIIRAIDFFLTHTPTLRYLDLLLPVKIRMDGSPTPSSFPT